MRDLRTIRREKQERLSDAKNQLTLRDQAYQGRSKAQQAEAGKVFETRLATLSSENPLFKPRENDATYNAQLETIVSAARQLYSGEGVTNEHRANAALYAASHSLLVGQLIAQQQEIEKMTKANAALKAKVPTVGSSGGEAPLSGGSEGNGGKAENMVERMARIARQSGFVK